ncbi:uncharacterized protein LOC135471009 [Liolophura sinensis]|uniref:uncharacterized protein LOC135471009 n=1 Tax=Liolophura sinensis TaxID=3198878 RepID=UPI00315906AA
MASTDTAETEDIDAVEDDDDDDDGDISGIGDLEGFEIVDEVEGDDVPTDQDNENRTSVEIADTIDEELSAESAVQKSLPEPHLSETSSSTGTEGSGGSDSGGSTTSGTLQTTIGSTVSTPASPSVGKKTPSVAKATPKAVKKTPVVKKTTVVIKKKKGTQAAKTPQVTKTTVVTVKSTVGGKATLVGVKATPVGVKVTPVGVKVTPVGVKATPKCVKSTPTAADATPTSAETPPTTAKATPGAAKTTPGAAKTTPTSVKTTPTSVKTTPTAVKTTPTATKTATAAKTTPAAVKTTPTSVKSTPTAIKAATAAKTAATPAPAKTTPTSVKTTPTITKTATVAKTSVAAKTTPTAVKVIPKAARTTATTAKATPAAGKATATAAKTTPIATMTTPAATKTAPKAAKTTPVTAKNLSAAVKTTPVAAKNTLVAVKTTPAKNTHATMTTPTAPKTTPAATKTTPVATDTMPVVVMKTTPVTVKATPSITKAAEKKPPKTAETTPETVMTTLTAIKLTPLSVKTTPVCVKTTPAAVGKTVKSAEATPAAEKMPFGASQATSAATKTTQTQSVGTKTSITATKAHPATAKTFPTAAKKIPIVARKTPISVKKSPIAAKKTLLMAKTTPMSHVATPQTVSTTPEAVKTTTATSKEPFIDADMTPAAVESMSAYTTLVTTKPSPVPTKATTVAAKIPPTTAIPAATSTTSAGANTTTAKAISLSDPKLTDSKNTTANPALPSEGVIPAEVNASAEIMSVSDDTLSGSVKVVETSTKVTPSVTKSTNLGPSNASKAMSAAMSTVTKRVTVALTRLQTPAVIKANLAVKGTNLPTQKHTPLAAKPAQASTAHVTATPSSNTCATRMDNLSQNIESVDSSKMPLQTPVSEESSSDEVVTKTPASDKSVPKCVLVKKVLKPGTNTLSVKSQSTGDLSAKAESTVVQKTVSTQSVPAAVSNSSPVEKSKAVKKSFVKPTTVPVKVMKGTGQSQPSSVKVVPVARKQTSPRPTAKTPVGKSVGGMPLQETTVKTSPVMKSPGSKTIVTKRTVQHQSRETMTETGQGQPVGTQTPEHMLQITASEMEGETSAARWVAERVAGKQERQLINRLKTVMLHPVQVEDLSDPALQPFILNCHCLSARFLSSQKGVQKKGHLEIRYFTEADAIKYVEDMKGLKLASGKYLTAKILGQCGPWDGTLDDWQRKNIAQQEGLAEARCVFVHNLPTDTQEDMLKLLYPEVVNISLHLPKEEDKKSTGHAVLEFLTPEDAEEVTNNSKKYETKIAGNTVTLTLILKRSLKPEAAESSSEKSPVKKAGNKHTVDAREDSSYVSPKKKAKSETDKDEIRYKGGDIRQFLLHWCYARDVVPQYSFKSWGPSHRLRFRCEAKVAKVDFVARGTGTSKKNAQYKCAYDFVKYLVREGKLKESSIKRCEEELVNLGLIPAPSLARAKDKQHREDNSHKQTAGLSKTPEKGDKKEEKGRIRSSSLEKRRSKEPDRQSREPKRQHNTAERASQHTLRTTSSLSPPRMCKESTGEEDLNIQALKSEITKQLAELQEGRVSDPDKLTELAEKLQSVSEAKQKGQHEPAEGRDQYSVPVGLKEDHSKDTGNHRAERKVHAFVQKQDKTDQRRDGVEHRRDTPDQRRDTPDHRKDTPDQRRDTPDRRKDTPDHRRDLLEHRKDTPDNRKDIPDNKRDALDRKRNIPDHRRVTPEKKRDTVDHRRDTPGHRRDASDHSMPASDRRRHTPERNRASSDISRQVLGRKAATPEKKNGLSRKGDMRGKNWDFDRNKKVSVTDISGRKRNTPSHENNSPDRKGDEYYDPFAMTSIKKARVESPTRESREMSHLLHLADMVRQNFGTELAQNTVPQGMAAMNKQDFNRDTAKSSFPAQVTSRDQKDFNRDTVKSSFPAKVTSRDQEDFNRSMAQTSFPQQVSILGQQDFNQGVPQNTFSQQMANIYQKEFSTNVAQGTCAEQIMGMGKPEFSRNLAQDTIPQQMNQQSLSGTVPQSSFSKQLLSIGQEKLDRGLGQSTLPQQITSLGQEMFNRDSKRTIPVQITSMGQQHFSRDSRQSNFPQQMTGLGQQNLKRDVTDGNFSRHISTISQQTVSREMLPSTFPQQTRTADQNTISQRTEPSRQQRFVGHSSERSIGDMIRSVREQEYTRHHTHSVQQIEVQQDFMRNSSQSTASQHISDMRQLSCPSTGVPVACRGLYSVRSPPHTAVQSYLVSEAMQSPWPQSQSEVSPCLTPDPELLKAQLINRLRQFQDGQLTDDSNILTQLAQQLLNVQRQEELEKTDYTSQQIDVSRAGINQTPSSMADVKMTTACASAHTEQPLGSKVDHSVIREKLLLRLQTAGITSGTINSLVKGLKTVQEEEKKSTQSIDSHSMCAVDKSDYTHAKETESKSSKISRNVKAIRFDIAKMKVQEQMKEKIQQIKQNQMALKMSRKRALATHPFTFVPDQTAINVPRGILKKTQSQPEASMSEAGWTPQSTSYTQTQTLESSLQTLTQQRSRNMDQQESSIVPEFKVPLSAMQRGRTRSEPGRNFTGPIVTSRIVGEQPGSRQAGTQMPLNYGHKRRSTNSGRNSFFSSSLVDYPESP